MPDDLSSLCPLCQLRTVQMANPNPSPWFEAFCTNMDCRYATPQFRSYEEVVDYHNGVVDRLRSYLTEFVVFYQDQITLGFSPEDIVFNFVVLKGFQ